MFDATISWQKKSARQRVFVVENFQTPLLGQPAIHALGVLAYLEAVEMQTQDPAIKGKSPEARPEFSTLFT